MDRKINIEKLLLYIGLIGVLIYGIHTYKEVNKPFRNQDVMEEMKNDKDSLVDSVKDKTTEFNNDRKKQIKNAKSKTNEFDKKIDNINNFNTAQRDSLWSILLTTPKDSLPERYWDLLEQRLRKKSSSSF